jgi:hypothetical protein
MYILIVYITVPFLLFLLPRLRLFFSFLHITFFYFLFILYRYLIHCFFIIIFIYCWYMPFSLSSSFFIIKYNITL